MDLAAIPLFVLTHIREVQYATLAWTTWLMDVLERITDE